MKIECHLGDRRTIFGILLDYSRGLVPGCELQMRTASPAHVVSTELRGSCKSWLALTARWAELAAQLSHCSADGCH
jgi:hypothetical protein